MLPRVRLSGNRDVAVRFIRQGKKELFRTRELRDKLGVPVYKRTIQADEYTVITILLDKEQEIISIDVQIPEGVQPVPEPPKPKEEPEPEKCRASFIVYRNPSYRTGHPVKAGHLITYDRDHWRLNEVPDTDKEGNCSAWWFVKERYDDYYDTTNLQQCALLTWRGMLGGAFSQSGAITNICMQGKTYNTGYIVYGACLLPDAATEKDYFYFLTRSESLIDPIVRVFRVERNPSGVPSMVTGTPTLVASYTKAQVLAITGGTALVESGQSAYVDANGMAYFSYTATTAVSHTGSGSLNMYRSLKINMVTGALSLHKKAEDYVSSMSGSRIAFKQDFGDNSKQWNYNSGTRYDGAESDIWTWHEDPPGAWHKIWKKATQEQTIHNAPSGADTLQRNFTDSGVVPMGIWGGCDALYELGIQWEPIQQLQEIKIQGSPMRSPNISYDATAANISPSSVASVPYYHSDGSYSDSGVDAKMDFVALRNGAEHFRFTVLEYSSAPWTTTDTVRILGGWDSVGGDPDKWGTNDCPGDRWEFGATLGRRVETLQPSARLETITQRKILFYHPMIHDIFSYLEFQIVRQVNTPPAVVNSYLNGHADPDFAADIVSCTVKYFFNGEERWSKSVAQETPKNLNVFFRFGNSTPVSYNNPRVPGNFTPYPGFDYWQYLTRGPGSSAGYSELGNTKLDYQMATTRGANGYYYSHASYFQANLWFKSGAFGVSYDDPYNVIDYGNFPMGNWFASYNMVLDISAGSYNLKNADYPSGEMIRASVAVQRKDSGPTPGTYPYLVYLQHPTAVQFVRGSGAFPGGLSMVPSGYGAPANGEFFSNCITLDELKKVTGMDQLRSDGTPEPDADYPVDFGVI